MHQPIVAHCQTCQTYPIIEQQTMLCARCWILRFDARRPAPEDAIAACEAYLTRAEQQFAHATTLNDQRDARLWIDNATRNLSKWRAFSARQKAQRDAGG
jgi:hypothetical protein